MNVDPDGHFALSTFLVCFGIGALVGFGGTVAVDYAEDGMLFNGSVSLGGYIANTLVVAALFASIWGAWFAGSTSISFSLPSIGSMLTSSGAPVAAVATTTVTVNGAVVIGGAIGLGMLGGLAFSWSGKGPKDKRNNQSQNREIDFLEKKYRIDKDTRRKLHDEITGQGYTKDVIETILRDLLKLPPR